MGRTARGVKSMKLADGESIISAVVLPSSDEETTELSLLSVCENGFGKRTAVSEYRSQNRGGKGLIDIKTNARNGKVCDAVITRPSDDVMMVTTYGKIIRLHAGDISQIGRNTQGVTLVRLQKDETVAGVTRVRDEESQEQADTEEESASS